MIESLRIVEITKWKCISCDCEHYTKAMAELCHPDYVPDVVNRSLKVSVKDRTTAQHEILRRHYGGIREYLLSMGDFKKYMKKN